MMLQNYYSSIVILYVMSSKNFCESGKHEYHEVDILMSAFVDSGTNEFHILVACNKCDSQFLRTVAKPLP